MTDSERARAWQLANRERYLSYQREYRRAHKEEAKAYQKKNALRISDLKRAWYLRHRDEILEKARKKKAGG